MKQYPRIRSVEALPGKKLRVAFEGGGTRIYDCRPLLNEEAFKPLQDEALFRSVKAEKHGYAVIWNDEVDLAESEIWLHGRAEQGVAGDRSRLHRPSVRGLKTRSKAKAGARAPGS